jgi:hypothetical protein
MIRDTVPGKGNMEIESPARPEAAQQGKAEGVTRPPTPGMLV